MKTNIPALVGAMAWLVMSLPATAEPPAPSDLEVFRFPEMGRFQEQIRNAEFPRRNPDSSEVAYRWERIGYMLGRQTLTLGDDPDRRRRFQAMRSVFERGALFVDYLAWGGPTPDPERWTGGEASLALQRGLLGATETFDEMEVSPVFEPLEVAEPATPTPDPRPAADVSAFDGNYQFRGNHGLVREDIEANVTGTTVKLRVKNAHGFENYVFDFTLTGGKVEFAPDTGKPSQMVGKKVSGTAYLPNGDAKPVDGEAYWVIKVAGDEVYDLEWGVKAGDFGGFARFGAQNWSHGTTNAASSVLRR